MRPSPDHRTCAVALAASMLLPRPRRGPAPCSVLGRGIHKRSGAAARLCAAGLLDACAGAVPPAMERRKVLRTEGGWRCSTVAAYLLHGDEITFYENFRMCREGFDHLIQLLREKTRLVAPGLGRTAASSAAHLKQQLHMHKLRLRKGLPTLEFKIAVCLYVLGQGGPMKPLSTSCGCLLGGGADACANGWTSLRGTS